MPFLGVARKNLSRPSTGPGGTIGPGVRNRPRPGAGLGARTGGEAGRTLKAPLSPRRFGGPAKDKNVKQPFKPWMPPGQQAGMQQMTYSSTPPPQPQPDLLASQLGNIMGGANPPPPPAPPPPQQYSAQAQAPPPPVQQPQGMLGQVVGAVGGQIQQPQPPQPFLGINPGTYNQPGGQIPLPAFLGQQPQQPQYGGYTIPPPQFGLPGRYRR